MHGLVLLIVIIVAIVVVALKASNMCKDQLGTTFRHGELPFREGLDGLEREYRGKEYMFGAGAIGGMCEEDCPSFRWAAPRDCTDERFVGTGSPQCIWTGKRTGFCVLAPGSTSLCYGSSKCDPFDAPYC